MFDIKINEILNTIYRNSAAFEQTSMFIEYIKEYIHELRILGYINEDNDFYVVHALNNLKQLLPYRFSNEENAYIVVIDTNQIGDNNLTKEEKIRLDLYQKIGEYILNNMHAYDIDVESNKLSTRGSIDVPDITDGFFSLNKAISQELAEQVLTIKTGKQRMKRMIKKPTVYEEPLESDFHANEILQEPTRLFAGTIYSEDKNSAFIHMIQKCFEPYFIKNIAQSKTESLTTLLMSLGQIKKVLDNKYQYSNSASIGMTFLQDFYHESQNNKHK